MEINRKKVIESIEVDVFCYTLDLNPAERVVGEQLADDLEALIKDLAYDRLVDIITGTDK